MREQPKDCERLKHIPLEADIEFQILAGSPDGYGMNNKLQDDEVDEGW